MTTQRRIGLIFFILTSVVILGHLIRWVELSYYDLFYVAIAIIFYFTIVYESLLSKVLQLFLVLSVGIVITLPGNDSQPIGIFILCGCFILSFTYGWLDKNFWIKTVILSVLYLSWFIFTSSEIFKFDIIKGSLRLTICVAMVSFLWACNKHFIDAFKNASNLEKRNLELEKENLELKLKLTLTASNRLIDELEKKESGE